MNSKDSLIYLIWILLRIILFNLNCSQSYFIRFKFFVELFDLVQVLKILLFNLNSPPNLNYIK